jgi:hypothetical protein
MSSGIPAQPISPRITSDGRILGITAITAMEIDLKTIKNSIKIIVKTVKIVFICDENKL